MSLSHLVCYHLNRHIFDSVSEASDWIPKDRILGPSKPRTHRESYATPSELAKYSAARLHYTATYVLRPQIPASACAPTPAPAVSRSELFILWHVVYTIARVFDTVQATFAAGDKLHQSLKSHAETGVGNRVMLTQLQVPLVVLGAATGCQ